MEAKTLKDDDVTEPKTINDANQEKQPTGLNGEADDPFLEVAKIAAERDDYLDQLQRAMADFANYKRRTEQERLQAREYATRDLLRQLLPIVDDFQRALAATPGEQQETPWYQGILLIEKKLQGLLEREGVAPVDGVGSPFDPAQHEAVASDPGSSGQYVVEIYQTGYRQKNNLLRPAMVRVGDKPADDTK
jgi:molecular chaperone GrpE